VADGYGGLGRYRHTTARRAPDKPIAVQARGPVAPRPTFTSTMVVRCWFGDYELKPRRK
jgi:hypothetical protein